MEKPNKIIVVSMVKNEADIIESFVRHTLTFADELLLAEHQSSDNTYEILTALAGEGLPITITRVYCATQIQSKVINSLTHEAFCARGADIVVPLDADEFLVNLADGESVRAYLQGLATDRIYKLDWVSYTLAAPEIDADKFILQRPLVRERAPQSIGKIIVGRDGFETSAQHLTIIQGNHGVAVDEVNDYYLPMEPTKLELVHFHYRSASQYEAKIAVGWLNNVSKYGKYTSAAHVWHRGYAELKRHERLATDQLEAMTEPVSLRDCAPEQRLRYTAGASADMTASLLSAAERVAQELVEVKVLRRHKTVAVIVPYLGSLDDLAATIDSLDSDLYPYKKIYIVDMVGGLAEAVEVTDDTVIVTAAGGSYADILRGVVTEDYATVILPGRTVPPDKLKRLVAFLDCQDQPFAIAAASGRGDSLSYMPEMSITITDPVQPVSYATLWGNLLINGQQLPGGIGACLARTEIMERADYLEGAYVGGYPLELAMWQRLLAATVGTDSYIGVLNDSLDELAESADSDRVLLQQLEWYNLLAADTVLDEREKELAYGRLWHNSQLLLQQAEALKNSPLWGDYLEIIERLARRSARRG